MFLLKVFAHEFLAFTGRYCLQPLSLWCTSIPTIISAFINWKNFSHLFVYSIICFCHYGLSDAYYISFVIIQPIITYFVAQLVPALDMGSPFSWAPMTF